ncbi:hypothetical protein, partial [Mycobacteroides abscessus]|uniref:hypothetical protein n=1 Tax=Mycobacteroides abscessus TaxID=36809 RepID=UPI0019D2E976
PGAPIKIIPIGKIVARPGSFLGVCDPCVGCIRATPGKGAVSAHGMSGVGRGHREIRRRSLAGGAVVRSVPSRRR